MTTVSVLRGVHPGQPATILANGPSLRQHDLRKLNRVIGPVIGMNRTHQLLDTVRQDYFVISDREWMGVPAVRDHPGLVRTESSGPGPGHQVPPCMADGFSFNLAAQGWESGNTTLLALQLATYVTEARADIGVLGLDLRGDHFDGTASAAGMIYQRFKFHAAEIQLQRRGIQVYVVGSPNSLADMWPRISFDDWLEKAAGGWLDD